jgi:hypothetical protein
MYSTIFNGLRTDTKEKTTKVLSRCRATQSVVRDSTRNEKTVEINCGIMALFSKEIVILKGQI